MHRKIEKRSNATSIKTTYELCHVMVIVTGKQVASCGEFPNAEEIGSRTFSLPLSPRLRDDQVDRIIDAVRLLLRPFF